MQWNTLKELRLTCKIEIKETTLVWNGFSAMMPGYKKKS